MVRIFSELESNLDFFLLETQYKGNTENRLVDNLVNIHSMKSAKCSYM